MLVLPVNQSVVGRGNVVSTGEQSPLAVGRSLHLSFLKADGTVYSGSGSAVLKIYVSNELDNNDQLKSIVNPVLLDSKTLDSATTSIMIALASSYRNIIVDVDTISDGKVSAFYYPESFSRIHW